MSGVDIDGMDDDMPDDAPRPGCVTTGCGCVFGFVAFWVLCWAIVFIFGWLS